MSGRRNESSRRLCGPLGYCQWGFPSPLLHKHVRDALFPHLHESQDLPLLISSPVGNDNMHIGAKLPDKALWTNIQENIIFLKATINSINNSANHWKGPCLWLKWLIRSQTGSGIQCRRCPNPVWRGISEVERGIILGQCGQCRLCEEFFTPADSNSLSKIVTSINDVSSEYWCSCPRMSVDLLLQMRLSYITLMITAQWKLVKIWGLPFTSF